MTPSLSSGDDASTTSGDDAPATTAESADASREAGRGGLAVASAKLYFLLTGLVQQAALPRLLGLTQPAALDACERLSRRGFACMTVPPERGSS